MKKLLLACSLIGLVATANAQPASTTPADHPPQQCTSMHDKMGNPAAQAEHLQKTLQLSDDQTAKVKKILEDSAAQRKAIDDKYKPQLEAFHTDMEKLHEQTHSQLNGVLTPKQQEALKAQWQMHEHMHEQRGPMHDGSMHDGPMHGEAAPAK